MNFAIAVLVWVIIIFYLWDRFQKWRLDRRVQRSLRWPPPEPRDPARRARAWSIAFICAVCFASLLGYIATRP